MPLDVQPLSATRRALMLVVLLLLFVGSLGLAQLIAYKRRVPAPAFVMEHPKGFSLDASGSDIAREANLALRGNVGGAPRFIYLFTDRSPTPPEGLSDDEEIEWLGQVAQGVFFKYLGSVNSRISKVAPEELAGHRAVEVQARIGNQGFGFMRTAYMGQQVVTLMYLGGSRPGQGDLDLWSQITAQYFHIRGETPPG